MNTILYGECVGTGGSAPVRISGLADGGCHLEPLASPALLGENVVLWIGAVGPFAAHAQRNDGRQFTLCFSEPLDRRILDHFGA